MNKIFSLIVSSVLLLNVMAQESNTVPDNNDAKLDWWKKARFGLFVHWGLYSVAGGDWKGHPCKGNEHFMLYEKIPLQTYKDSLATRFNPTKFDADTWVKAVKGAGMKYIVITTKHHEGFAMYNSPSNDYNIVQATPYHKDPMKALAAACRKYGIKLCFYYSLGRDWADPDVPTNWPVKGGRSNTWDYPNEDGKVFDKYFRRKVIPQVTELLTQYGPVGVLWFDTPELISAPESKELRALINKLQPSCIINERIGNRQGDFDVSEQKLRKDSIAAINPWESCITISKCWGYNRHDTVFKSAEVLVRNLIEVASANGNLLLNVGPTNEGEIPQKSLDRLASVGKWMQTNGEAIYGTKAWKLQGEQSVIEKKVEKETAGVNTMKDVLNDATSQKTPADIRFTSKGNNVYVFARSWRETFVTVKSLGIDKGNGKVSEVKLLGYNRKINWEQEANALRIEVPNGVDSLIPIYTFRVKFK